jgi:GAF domain-containing protein
VARSLVRGIVKDMTSAEHADLSARMAAAARDLQEQDNPEHTYTTATSLAVDNVDGCQGAGLIIVHRRKEIEMLAATHDDVRTCDRLQQELSEGPCLDAMWEETTITSPSLAHDQRWPTWGPKVAKDPGMNSVLSFQLFTHGDTLGALNLYSRERDAFTADDRDNGLALAAHIAIAVTAAQKIDNLNTALGSRTVIGEATGILMERYDLTSGVAFSLLARTSSEEQVKIRVLAQRLVDTRARQD